MMSKQNRHAIPKFKKCASHPQYHPNRGIDQELPLFSIQKHQNEKVEVNTNPIILKAPKYLPDDIKRWSIHFSSSYIKLEDVQSEVNLNDSILKVLKTKSKLYYKFSNNCVKHKVVKNIMKSSGLNEIPSSFDNKKNGRKKKKKMRKRTRSKTKRSLNQNSNLLGKQTRIGRIDLFRKNKRRYGSGIIQNNGKFMSQELKVLGNGRPKLSTSTSLPRLKCSYKIRKISTSHDRLKRISGIGGNDDNKWNVHWGKLSNFEFVEMCQYVNKYQRINHFPGSSILGRKDGLYRSFRSMQRKFGNEAFNFIPKSFLLPDEFSAFRKAFISKRRNLKALYGQGDHGGTNPFYIAKPKSSSRGRGIHIVNSLKEVEKLKRTDKSYIVSEYLKNPLLINKKKFDLRVYVLMTSLNPLRLYFYNDGLVRISAEKYSLDSKRKFIHLTNYSINKNHENFEVKESFENLHDVKHIGNKWTLGRLKCHFEKIKMSHIYDQIIDEIHEVAVKTFLCVEEKMQKSLQNVTKERGTFFFKNKVFFELFGFDILIDNNMKPWLLEVNCNPSFGIKSSLDKQLKSKLIVDTLNLLQIKHFKRKDHYKSLLRKRKDRFTNRKFKKEFNYPGIEREKKRSLYELKKCNELDFLTKEEINVLSKSEEEFHHIGNFERIFPEKYGKFFLFMRERKFNILCYKYFKQKKEIES